MKILIQLYLVIVVNSVIFQNLNILVVRVYMKVLLIITHVLIGRKKHIRRCVYVIYLYSGTPGSGKSLDVARLISDKLQFGKPVIANFDIDISQIKKCKGDFVCLDNDNLTPNFLINYSSDYHVLKNFKVSEESILLVIDECQLLFNSRDWNIKGRSDWLTFFTQHRKFKYEIVLIAQFDRMLDRQIRCLFEYEYIHRKIGNIGKMGKLIKLFTFGELFVCVKVWYPMKKEVGSYFFKAHKRYLSLYNSYKMFGAQSSIEGRESSIEGAHLSV